AEANAVQLKDWAVAANRLYYAVYYIVSALLVKNNYIAHTYAGTRILFNQHFIKTGIVSKELGRLYSKLFETRQMGDYDDFFDLEEKDIFPLLEPVNAFICEIEKLINIK
ncbi:MAG: HEPN domain-containing protein, partial [Prevotellaceae bacterium]|nr:HEPN domain-containing protein [Prevotellaceae bacterium]